MKKKTAPNRKGKWGKGNSVPSPQFWTWTYAISSTTTYSPSQQVSSAVSLAAFLPLPFSWPKADVIIFNEHLQKLHIKHAAGTGHEGRWKGGGRREEGSQRQEVANLFMARMRLYVGRGASTDKVEPKKMLQTLLKAKGNFKIPTKNNC